MRLIKYICILLVVFAFVVSTGEADAVSSLRLSDGTETITIVDGGIGDTMAETGVVGYAGSLGMFYDFSFTTGFTSPFIGTSTVPVMHLNSLNFSSSGPSTLTIEFSSTGFTDPLGLLLGLTTTVGGTTDGSVLFNTYLDSSNTLFGTGASVASLGTYSGGQFDDSVFNSAPAGLSPGPYSVTTVAKISHGNGSNISGFDVDVSPAIAPEPMSYVLFLAGGATMALIGYRRKR